MPSTKAEKEIKKVLAGKIKQKELLGNNSILLKDLVECLNISPFGSVPYENRSIETLEKNLESVKETYKEHDLYEIFEAHADMLNFDILNGANEYIRDATCVLEIERNESFMVAAHIFEEPQEDNLLMLSIKANQFAISQYPTVDISPTSFKISQHIGDIKHQIPRKAFGENIRLTIIKVPADGFIKLSLKLFAKNLPSPLMKKFKIIVEEKEEGQEVQVDKN